MNNNITILTGNNSKIAVGKPIANNIPIDILKRFMARDSLPEYRKDFDEPIVYIFGEFEGLYKGSLARVFNQWFVDDYNVLLDTNKIGISTTSFYIFAAVSQIKDGASVVRAIRERDVAKRIGSEGQGLLCCHDCTGILADVEDVLILSLAVEE